MIEAGKDLLNRICTYGCSHGDYVSVFQHNYFANVSLCIYGEAFYKELVVSLKSGLCSLLRPRSRPSAVMKSSSEEISSMIEENLKRRRQA